MIQRQFKLLLGILCLWAATSSAAYLKYAERSLKYPTEQGWEPYLQKHWDYWKGKFNTQGGIIKATKPDNTTAEVSEAQAYGMLLALWFNDKAAFDQIYKAAQDNFWNSGNGYYGWIIAPTKDPNFAGDADQDILGALIFASALVDSTQVTGWTNPTNGAPKYKDQAKILLASIGSKFVDGSHLIRSWTGSNGIYNPSYHMPGWVQVFKEFGAANGVADPGWDAVRTAEYGLFNSQPNAKSGMARNWNTDPGNGTETPSNGDMSFDAIRVPYRIGMDAIWYPNHSQAISWCKSVWSAGAVNPKQPGMYLVNGPTLWGWGSASDNPPYSTSQYEWALSTAMWGTCAVAVQDSSTAGGTAANMILNNFTIGVSNHPWFQLSAGSDTTTGSAPNKNYYAQSLALLGALAMDGRAWNVWDDLKNKWTPPDTVARVTKALTATPDTTALSGSVTFTAQFSHSISWTLTMTGATSGSSYSIPGSGPSLNVTWTPASQHGFGKVFTGGEKIMVTVKASWATPPAGTSITVYTTATNALQASQNHRSAFSWTSEGLRLPAGMVEDGQSIQIRVLDLSGRQQGNTRQATAHTSGNGTVLDVAPQHTAQAGLVELRDANGSVERLLLPPIR